LVLKNNMSNMLDRKDLNDRTKSINNNLPVYDVAIKDDLINNLETIKNLYKKALYGINSVNNQTIDSKTVNNLVDLMKDANNKKIFDNLKFKSL